MNDPKGGVSRKADSANPRRRTRRSLAPQSEQNNQEEGIGHYARGNSLSLLHSRNMSSEGNTRRHLSSNGTQRHFEQTTNIHESSDRGKLAEMIRSPLSGGSASFHRRNQSPSDFEVSEKANNLFDQIREIKKRISEATAELTPTFYPIATSDVLTAVSLGQYEAAQHLSSQPYLSTEDPSHNTCSCCNGVLSYLAHIVSTNPSFEHPRWSELKNILKDLNPLEYTSNSPDVKRALNELVSVSANLTVSTVPIAEMREMEKRLEAADAEVTHTNEQIQSLQKLLNDLQSESSCRQRSISENLSASSMKTSSIVRWLDLATSDSIFDSESEFKRQTDNSSRHGSDPDQFDLRSKISALIADKETELADLRRGAVVWASKHTLITNKQAEIEELRAVLTNELALSPDVSEGDTITESVKLKQSNVKNLIDQIESLRDDIAVFTQSVEPSIAQQVIPNLESLSNTLTNAFVHLRPLEEKKPVAGIATQVDYLHDQQSEGRLTTTENNELQKVVDEIVTSFLPSTASPCHLLLREVFDSLNNALSDKNDQIEELQKSVKVLESEAEFNKEAIQILCESRLNMLEQIAEFTGGEECRDDFADFVSKLRMNGSLDEHLKSLTKLNDILGERLRDWASRRKEANEALLKQKDEEIVSLLARLEEDQALIKSHSEESKLLHEQIEQLEKSMSSTTKKSKSKFGKLGKAQQQQEIATEAAPLLQSFEDSIQLTSSIPLNRAPSVDSDDFEPFIGAVGNTEVTESTHDLQSKLSEQAAMINQLEARLCTQNEEFQSKLAGANEKISQFNAIQSSYETDLLRLKSVLIQKTGDISELSAKLNLSNQSIATLNGQITELRTEVATVQEKSTAQSLEMERVQGLMHDKNQETSNLREVIASHEAQIQNLRFVLNNKDADFKQKNKQIEILSDKLSNSMHEAETLKHDFDHLNGIFERLWKSTLLVDDSSEYRDPLSPIRHEPMHVLKTSSAVDRFLSLLLAKDPGTEMGDLQACIRVYKSFKDAEITHNGDAEGNHSVSIVHNDPDLPWNPCCVTAVTAISTLLEDGKIFNLLRDLAYSESCRVRLANLLSNAEAQVSDLSGMLASLKLEVEQNHIQLAERTRQLILLGIDPDDPSLGKAEFETPSPVIVPEKPTEVKQTPTDDSTLTQYAKDLQIQLQYAQQHIIALEKRCEDAETTNIEAIQKLAQVEKQVAFKTSEDIALPVQNIRALAELLSTEPNAELIVEKVESLQEELLVNLAERGRLQQQLHKVRDQLEKLNKGLSNQNAAKLSEIEGHLTSVLIEKSSLEEQLNEQRDEINRRTAYINKLEAERSQLSSQLSKSEATLKSKESAIESLNQKIHLLELDNERKSSECVSLQANMENLTKQLNFVKSTAVSLDPLVGPTLVEPVKAEPFLTSMPEKESPRVTEARYEFAPESSVNEEALTTALSAKSAEFTAFHDRVNQISQELQEAKTALTNLPQLTVEAVQTEPLLSASGFVSATDNRDLVLSRLSELVDQLSPGSVAEPMSWSDLIDKIESAISSLLRDIAGLKQRLAALESEKENFKMTYDQLSEARIEEALGAQRRAEGETRKKDEELKVLEERLQQSFTESSTRADEIEKLRQRILILEDEISAKSSKMDLLNQKIKEATELTITEPVKTELMHDSASNGHDNLTQITELEQTKLIFDEQKIQLNESALKAILKEKECEIKTLENALKTKETGVMTAELRLQQETAALQETIAHNILESNPLIAEVKSSTQKLSDYKPNKRASEPTSIESVTTSPLPTAEPLIKYQLKPRVVDACHEYTDNSISLNGVNKDLLIARLRSLTEQFSTTSDLQTEKQKSLLDLMDNVDSGVAGLLKAQVSLKQQLGFLETKSSELKQQLELNEAKLQIAEGELLKRDASLHDLEGNMEEILLRLHSQINSLTEIVNSSEGRVTELLSMLRSSRINESELKAQLDCKSDRESRLQSELSKLTSENADLLLKCDQMNETLSERTTKLAEIEDTLKANEDEDRVSRLMVAEQTCKKLEIALTLRDQEVKSLEDSLKSKENTLTMLEDSFKVKVEEINNLTAKVHEAVILAEELDVLKQKLRAIDEEKVVKTRECIALAEEVASLNQKLSTAMAREAVLMSLSPAIEKATDFQQKIIELNQENEVKTAQIAKLEFEVTSLNSKLENLQGKHDINAVEYGHLSVEAVDSTQQLDATLSKTQAMDVMEPDFTTPLIVEQSLASAPLEVSTKTGKSELQKLNEEQMTYIAQIESEKGQLEDTLVAKEVEIESLKEQILYLTHTGGVDLNTEIDVLKAKTSTSAELKEMKKRLVDLETENSHKSDEILRLKQELIDCDSGLLNLEALIIDLNQRIHSQMTTIDSILSANEGRQADLLSTLKDLEAKFADKVSKESQLLSEFDQERSEFSKALEEKAEIQKSLESSVKELQINLEQSSQKSNDMTFELSELLQKIKDLEEEITKKDEDLEATDGFLEGQIARIAELEDSNAKLNESLLLRERELELLEQKVQGIEGEDKVSNLQWRIQELTEALKAKESEIDTLTNQSNAVQVDEPILIQNVDTSPLLTSAPPSFLKENVNESVLTASLLKLIEKLPDSNDFDTQLRHSWLDMMGQVEEGINHLLEDQANLKVKLGSVELEKKVLTEVLEAGKTHLQGLNQQIQEQQAPLVRQDEKLHQIQALKTPTSEVETFESLNNELDSLRQENEQQGRTLTDLISELETYKTRESVLLSMVSTDTSQPDESTKLRIAELERSLELKQSELDSLQNQFAETKQVPEEILTSKENYQNALIQLENDLKAKEIDLNQLTAVTKSQAMELDSLHDRLRELEEANGRKSDEIEKLIQKLEQTKVQVPTLSVINPTLIQPVAVEHGLTSAPPDHTRSVDVNLLVARISYLLQKMSDPVDSQSEVRRNWSDLMDQVDSGVSRLMKSLEDLKTKIITLESDLDRRDALIESLYRELSVRNDSLHVLEASIIELSTRLNHNLNNLEDTIDTGKYKVLELLSLIDDLGTKNDQLEGLLTKLENDRKELKEKLKTTEVQAKMEPLSLQSSALEEQLQSLQAEIVKKDENLRSMESKLQQAILEYSKESESVLAEAEELHRQLQVLQEMKEQKSFECSALQDQVDNLTKELEVAKARQAVLISISESLPETEDFSVKKDHNGVPELQQKNEEQTSLISNLEDALKAKTDGELVLRQKLQILEERLVQKENKCRCLVAEVSDLIQQLTYAQAGTPPLEILKQDLIVPASVKVPLSTSPMPEDTALFELSRKNKDQGILIAETDMNGRQSEESLDSNDSEINSLKDHLSHLRDLMKTHLQSNAKFTPLKDAAADSAELELMRMCLQGKDKDIQLLTNEICELQKKLVERDATLQNLEAGMTQLHSKLTSQLSGLENTLNSGEIGLAMKTDNENELLQELSKALETKEEALKSLQEEKELLEAKLQQSLDSFALGTLQERIHSLEDENTRKAVEYKSLLNEVDDLTVELNAVKAREAVLLSTVELSVRDSLKEESDLFARTPSTSEVNDIPIDELLQEVHAVRFENEELLSRITEIESLLRLKDEELVKATENADSSNKVIEEVHQRAKALEQENELKTAELKDVSKKLQAAIVRESLTPDEAAVQARESELKCKVMELEATIQSKEAKLKSLEEEISKLSPNAIARTSVAEELRQKSRGLEESHSSKAREIGLQSFIPIIEPNITEPVKSEILTSVPPLKEAAIGQNLAAEIEPKLLPNHDEEGINSLPAETSNISLDSEAEIQYLRGKLDALQREMQQVADFNSLAKELETTGKSRELGLSSADIDELRKADQEKTALINHLESDLKSKEVALQTLEDRLNQLMRERDDLHGKLRLTVDQQLSNAVEAEKLKADVREARDDLAKRNRDLQNIESSLTDLSNRLFVQLNDLEGTMNSGEPRVFELLSLLYDYEVKDGQWKRESNGCSQIEMQELQKRMDDLQNTLDQKVTDYNSLKFELASIKARESVLVSYTTNEPLIQAGETELKAKLDELESTLKLKEGEIVTAQISNEELHKKLIELKDLNDKKTAEFERMKAYLEDIQTSKVSNIGPTIIEPVKQEILESTSPKGAAELESLRHENENLLAQVANMESTLKSKVDELKTLRNESEKLSRDSQTTEFDLRNQLRALQEEIGEKEVQCFTLNQELQETKARESVLISLSPDEAGEDQLKSQIANLEANLRMKEEEFKILEGETSKLSKNANDSALEAEELRKKLGEMEGIHAQNVAEIERLMEELDSMKSRETLLQSMTPVVEPSIVEPVRSELLTSAPPMPEFNDEIESLRQTVVSEVHDSLRPENPALSSHATDPQNEIISLHENGSRMSNESEADIQDLGKKLVSQRAELKATKMPPSDHSAVSSDEVETLKMELNDVRGTLNRKVSDFFALSTETQRLKEELDVVKSREKDLRDLESSMNDLSSRFLAQLKELTLTTNLGERRISDLLSMIGDLELKENQLRNELDNKEHEIGVLSKEALEIHTNNESEVLALRDQMNTLLGVLDQKVAECTSLTHDLETVKARESLLLSLAPDETAKQARETELKFQAAQHQVTLLEDEIKIIKEDMRDKIASLSQSIEDSTAEAEQLRQQLKEKEDFSAQKIMECEKLWKQLEAVKPKEPVIPALEPTLVEQVKSELLTQSPPQTETDVQALSSRLTELKVITQDKDDKFEDLQEKIEQNLLARDLRQELESLQEEFGRQEVKCNSLKQELESMKATTMQCKVSNFEVGTLRKMLEEHELRIQELGEENINKTTECESLRIEVERLKDEVDLAQENEKNLNEIESNIFDLSTHLTSQLNTLVETIDYGEIRVRDLISLVKYLKSRESELINELDEELNLEVIKNKLNEKEFYTKDKEEEFNKLLQESSDNFQTEIQELQRQLETLKADSEQRDSLLMTLTPDKSENQSSETELRSKIVDLETILQSKEGKIKDLQDRIQEEILKQFQIANKNAIEVDKLHCQLLETEEPVTEPSIVEPVRSELLTSAPPMPEFNDEIESLRQENDVLTSRNTGLETSLRDKECEIANLSEEIQSIRKQLEQKTADIDALNQKLGIAEARESVLISLTPDDGVIQAGEDQLKSQIASLEANLRMKEEEFKILEGETSKLSKNANDSALEAEELRKKLGEMEGIHAQNVAEIERLMEELDSMKSRETLLQSMTPVVEPSIVEPVRSELLTSAPPMPEFNDEIESLRQENDVLTSRNTGLETSLRDKECEIANLSEEIQSIRKQLEQKTADIDALNQKLGIAEARESVLISLTPDDGVIQAGEDQLKSQIASLEANLRMKEEEFKILEGETSKLSKNANDSALEAEELRKKLGEMEGIHAQNVAEIERLMEELDSMKSRETLLQSMTPVVEPSIVEPVRSELLTSAPPMPEFNDEIESLRQENDVLTSRNTGLETSLRDKECEIANLSEEIQSIRKQLEQKTADIDALNQKLGIAEARESVLISLTPDDGVIQAGEDQLKSQIASLEANLRMKEEEFKILEGETSKLSKNANDSALEAEELRKKLGEMEGIHAQNVAEIERLMEELDSMKSRETLLQSMTPVVEPSIVEPVRSELLTSAPPMPEFNDEIESLRQENDVLTSRNTGLETSLRDKECEIANLSEEIQSIRKQLEQKTADIDALNQKLGIAEARESVLISLTSLSVEHKEISEFPVEQQTSRIAELESALTSKEGKIVPIKRNLPESDDIILPLSVSLGSENSELIVLKESLEENPEVKYLRKCLRSAEYDNYKNCEDIKQLVNELVYHEKELQKRERDINDFEAKLIDVSSRLFSKTNDLSAIVDSGERRISDLMSIVEELNARDSDFRNEITKLEASEKRLQSQLDEESVKYRKLVNYNAKLKTEKDELNKRCNMMIDEMKCYSDEQKTLADALKAREVKQKFLEETLKARNNEMEQLKQRLQALENANSCQIAEIESLSQELNEVKAKEQVSKITEPSIALATSAEPLLTAIPTDLQADEGAQLARLNELGEINKKLEESLESKENDCKALQNTLRMKENELEDMVKLMKCKESDLTSLEESLQQMSLDMDSLNEQIQHLEKENSNKSAELETAIKMKEALVRKLEDVRTTSIPDNQLVTELQHKGFCPKNLTSFYANIVEKVVLLAQFVQETIDIVNIPTAISFLGIPILGCSISYLNTQLSSILSEIRLAIETKASPTSGSEVLSSSRQDRISPFVPISSKIDSPLSTVHESIDSSSITQALLCVGACIHNQLERILHQAAGNTITDAEVNSLMSSWSEFFVKLQNLCHSTPIQLQETPFTEMPCLCHLASDEINRQLMSEMVLHQSTPVPSTQSLQGDYNSSIVVNKYYSQSEPDLDFSFDQHARKRQVIHSLDRFSAVLPLYIGWDRKSGMYPLATFSNQLSKLRLSLVNETLLSPLVEQKPALSFEVPSTELYLRRLLNIRDTEVLYLLSTHPCGTNLINRSSTPNIIPSGDCIEAQLRLMSNWDMVQPIDPSCIPLYRVKVPEPDEIPQTSSNGHVEAPVPEAESSSIPVLEVSQSSHNSDTAAEVRILLRKGWSILKEMVQTFKRPNRSKPLGTQADELLATSLKLSRLLNGESEEFEVQAENISGGDFKKIPESPGLPYKFSKAPIQELIWAIDNLEDMEELRSLAHLLTQQYNTIGTTLEQQLNLNRDLRDRLREANNHLARIYLGISQGSHRLAVMTERLRVEAEKHEELSSAFEEITSPNQESELAKTDNGREDQSQEPQASTSRNSERKKSSALLRHLRHAMKSKTKK
nr:hypothetical transcript [Hymenolepis microstoma]